MSKVLAVSSIVCLLALPVMVSAGPVAGTAPAATPATAVKAPAPAAPAAASEAPAKFRFGGDERIRLEVTDKIPVGFTGKNEYYRFCTRLWAEFDIIEKVTLRARIANEWRKWQEPDKSGVADVATYAFPDEFVVDNLSLSFVCPLTGADIKLGRQDIFDINSRILMDGTPEDGSRTYFFDAARVTYKGFKDTTVDVLGIYNQPEADLVIEPLDRELTGFTGSIDDMTESGGAIYVKNSSVKTLPCEVYGVYKQESEWNQTTNSYKGYGWQTLEADKTVNAKSDIYTVGLKLKPDLGGGVKGSAEAAYQFGERGDADIGAYMFDANVTYMLPVVPAMKPTVCATWYYLTGDDASTTGKDEGWDPLWARWPQNSELLVFVFPRGKWSNISMPGVKASICPHKRVKTTLTAEHCTAPEGSATGDEIGWLYTARVDYDIAESLLLKKDKLGAYVLLEVLDPGDYYTSTDTAYFLRTQLLYTF